MFTKHVTCAKFVISRKKTDGKGPEVMSQSRDFRRDFRTSAFR